MAKDPVCGMDVEEDKAAGTAEYKGNITSVRQPAKRNSRRRRTNMRKRKKQPC